MNGNWKIVIVEIYATFMEHQCARTCGKCHSEDEDLEPESGSSEEIIEPIEKEKKPNDSDERGGESGEQIRGRPRNKMGNGKCYKMAF